MVGDAPGPLLKHNEIESNGRQSSSSDVPVSVATCHRRASSRCSLMLCLRGNPAISRMSHCGNTVPLIVFSREITRLGALVLYTALIERSWWEGAQSAGSQVDIIVKDGVFFDVADGKIMTYQKGGRPSEGPPRAHALPFSGLTGINRAAE